MALDRQSIERKDFPIGHRGYDPDAVDAHLTAIAEEISEFKSTARRRSETLASSASDQVRAILEAAETSASDIQREAENEAREIREEARHEAEAAREHAAEQVRGDVGKVSESTTAMLQRLDAIESEVSSLIDNLRTSGNRLDSDLRLLEGDLRDIGEAIAPDEGFELEDETPPVAVAPAPEFAEDYSSEAASVPPAYESAPLGGAEPLAAAPEEEVSGDTHNGEVFSEPAPRAHAESSDDAEGARLIALNMALNGTPRDETARYLSENFSLADSDSLLDEVYASVDG